MTAFIFAVINVLVVKFTHKNLSVPDCYRFFLLAFKETFPNLELLCSLFTVTDYQFISLTRGICETLNIFSLKYFLSIHETFNIYSKSKRATVEKSVSSIYLFQTRTFSNHLSQCNDTISSSKAMIPVETQKKPLIATATH